MWRAPVALPDLRSVSLASIDTETKDERLAADLGPGWPFRMGYICGVSVAWRDESGIQARYFPIRHPDTEGFAPERIYEWVCDHIAAGVRFVTQNGLYDWGWFRAEAGILMPDGEQLEEIGALATLVDEDRFSYSLENLCKWRGLPGKDESGLVEGIKSFGLIGKRKKKVNTKAYIWAMPARYVGPYAETDAVRTLELFESLAPIIDQEGTRDAYRLECAILPMVQEMQAHGVRIDTDAAERNRDLLFGKRDTLLDELSQKLEIRVGMDELHKDSWLASTFDRIGVKYPFTDTGKPSFKGGGTGWMTRDEHWLPNPVSRIERYHHAGYTFLQSHIIDHVVNGRIHASANPHRSSADGKNKGAKSFRFSYSEPPLQQMPGRNKEITPLIRGCFLPEEGQVWAKLDASQQEFRLVVHYACMHGLTGAEGARDEYINNPKADFHQHTANTTGLDRDSGKKFNFSKIYGAGIKRLAADIGKSLSETERLLDQYDKRMPFISQLDSLCQNLANKDGHFEVYGGGRRHFVRFAPYGKWTKGAGPCELDEALERVRDPKHPWYRQNITRAKTYTALNALIQSSAAVHTKLWMRAVWRAGHRCTLLQVHDCLECSVGSKDEAEAIARLGEAAVQLAVPMLIDRQYGRSWASAKHSWEELHSLPATDPVPPVTAPPIQPKPEPPPVKESAIPPVPPSQAHTNGLGTRSNGGLPPGGSRTAEELEQNAYSAEHADDPYDDSHLIRQGYALKQAYSYTLPDGTELYQNVRYELKPGIAETKKRRRKAFLIRRKVNGLWVFGAGERRVPYNWPTLMRAGPGHDIFVCEGESNADALISRGFLATTVLAHKWGPECVGALTGMDAIILEDHDAHGERNANSAQAALESNAASTRVVPYPHLWAKLPEKNRTTPPQLHEDIKNWLEDRGGDPAKLMEICREIAVKGAEIDEINTGELMRGNLPPTRKWLMKGYFCRGFVSSVVSPGSVGKTTLRLTQAIELAIGRQLLNSKVFKRTRVLVLSFEDDIIECTGGFSPSASTMVLVLTRLTAGCSSNPCAGSSWRVRAISNQARHLSPGQSGGHRMPPAPARTFWQARNETTSDISRLPKKKPGPGTSSRRRTTTNTPNTIIDRCRETESGHHRRCYPT
jgi:DNA polymerase I-like protein with 3'-5' exonuclease and polymerase domains